jgi:hypothetical protein
MIRWTRLTLPLAALVLGACTPPPEEVTTAAEGSSSSGTSVGPTTTPQPTTMPGEDTVGTQGASGTDTTMGVVDTTAGMSTTDGGTTMSIGATTSSDGGESSSGGSSSGPPECVLPCPNNEICDAMGECVPACNPWGDSSYAYCLDQYGTVATDTLCGLDHTCGLNGDPIQSATCLAQGCASICDCAAPADGNAVVTCGNLTLGDMTPDCYLSCANGEMCPTGMDCVVGTNDTYCAQPVQPLAMYGNCDDVAAPCMGGECATADNGMGQVWSVCVTLCPGGICDAAPGGALLGSDCGGVIFPPDGSECHLDCNNSGDCPAGMACIDTNLAGVSTLCMWP